MKSCLRFASLLIRVTRPVIDFETWRVAILNYLDEIHPEKIDFMERHNETDEVFVLIKGQALLFLGEGELRIEKIHPQVMEPRKDLQCKAKCLAYSCSQPGWFCFNC